MEEPLVTVLIVCFNHAPYVRDAIESAFGQSYASLEIVVVDDGSTDDSRSVISTYGDRITFLAKRNGGQASALNAGFARSKGEIVAFLDGDDVLLPKTIARVVAAFRAHPAVGLIQSRVEVADETTRPLGIFVPSRHIRLPNGDLRLQPDAWATNSWWSPTSGLAAASRVLARVFPLPEAVYRTSADHGLARATALCAPMVSLDEVGAYYRSHSTNQSYNVRRIDLNRTRTDLATAIASHAFLRTFAKNVGVEGYPVDHDTLLDTLTQRTLLLKLGSPSDGMPGDSIRAVTRNGVKAAWRRPDVRWEVRLLHGCWFVAMAVLPRAAAARFANASVARESPRSVRALRAAIAARLRKSNQAPRGRRV